MFGQAELTISGGQESNPKAEDEVLTPNFMLSRQRTESGAEDSLNEKTRAIEPSADASEQFNRVRKYLRELPNQFQDALSKISKKDFTAAVSLSYNHPRYGLGLQLISENFSDFAQVTDPDVDVKQTAIDVAKKMMEQVAELTDEELFGITDDKSTRFKEIYAVSLGVGNKGGSLTLAIDLMTKRVNTLKTAAA